MNVTEIRQLADQQLSGTLAAVDFDRLETLLQEPANRREYLRYCFLHGELACSDQVLRSLAPQAELTAPTASRSWRDAWCFALTAALLLCFIASAFYWEPQLRRPVG
ncbi:MAG TPA: hypothetical protein VL096_01970, partial [Pirellulaceae bacterium]|nr:hypothetical protein [Pirellulaceae bacterium]